MITRRFGRRGAVLLLFGVVWTLCGIGFAVVRQDRFSRTGPGGILEFLDSTPIPGIIWIICGVLAIVNALIRRSHDNEDAWGFAALIIPTCMWVLGYAWSFAFWVFTDNHAYGRGSSILGVLIFGVMAVVTRIIAGWPDDTDLRTDGVDP